MVVRSRVWVVEGSGADVQRSKRPMGVQHQGGSMMILINEPGWTQGRFSSWVVCRSNGEGCKNSDGTISPPTGVMGKGKEDSKEHRVVAGSGANLLTVSCKGCNNSPGLSSRS